jgi:tetratricopeptide (TPR) repeat protein
MPPFAATIRALALVGAAAGVAFAQSTHPHTPPSPFVPAAVRERPIALRQGIGTVHERVTTASKTAQAFYDQALAFLHGYVWIDAERSFRQALEADPALAMAHLGLSYTGWELQGAEAARTALEAARAAQAGASERERVRIRLRGLQLEAVLDSRDPARRAAYVKALDEALAADAEDVELLLLRGMADDPDPAGRGMGSGLNAVEYFQRALARSPDHPAAHHYLTHAYENAGRIDAALKHGAIYVRLAPAVAHAHHMYGHDLRRVGRMDEAIAEFRAAYDIETDPARVREVPPEYDWHHSHNLDLLATSYQYVGQLSAAEPLLRRSFAIASPFAIQAFNKREWPAFLLARGRASEALSAARELQAQPSPLVQAVGRIFEGRSLLSLGRFAEAAASANAAMKDLDRAGPEAVLAAADLKALQAEFYLRTGQRDRARPLFEDAVARLRSRPGPDAWIQALFALETMARTACAAGDWRLAASLADAMRSHDPAYGGTHFVSALVAGASGDRAAERRELEAAKQAWAKADPDFQERRDIESRLAALAKPPFTPPRDRARNP